MVKSMVNSWLPEFSDFNRVFFSPVKVVCNGPNIWFCVILCLSMAGHGRNNVLSCDQ